MLNLLKKLFGAKSAQTEAPYKMEAPKLEAKPAKKKPSVKKATTRKPKAAKAPKA